MKKILSILFIVLGQLLLSGADSKMERPPELVSLLKASGLVFEKGEIVSNIGTWQLYEVVCSKTWRHEHTGVIMETRFWVYFIKDKNTEFSDFCVFKSKAEISQAIKYFKDRWNYLADGIDKGLINFMEAGGTDVLTLAFYFAHGEGWQNEGRNGNLILDGLRPVSLRRYIREISEVNHPEPTNSTACQVGEREPTNEPSRANQ